MILLLCNYLVERDTFRNRAVLHIWNCSYYHYFTIKNKINCWLNGNPLMDIEKLFSSLLNSSFILKKNMNRLGFAVWIRDWSVVWICLYVELWELPQRGFEQWKAHVSRLDKDFLHSTVQIQICSFSLPKKKWDSSVSSQRFGLVGSYFTSAFPILEERPSKIFPAKSCYFSNLRFFCTDKPRESCTVNKNHTLIYKHFINSDYVKPENSIFSLSHKYLGTSVWIYYFFIPLFSLNYHWTDIS